MKGKYIIATVLAASMFFQSCSLKEDRTTCPCILNIDWSSVRSDERLEDCSSADSVLLLVGDRFNSIIRMSEYPDGQSVNITRSKTFVDCYLGMSQDRLSSSRSKLIIPLGEECDRLFSCHRSVEPDVYTEEVFLTPKLANEFTKVVIEFEDLNSTINDDDNILRVFGSSCGLDLLTGLPLSGGFQFDMSVYQDRSWSFNMPRQKEKDISIDVLSRKDESKLFSVNLAEQLDAAGYGWAAESLAPLVVVKISAQNIPVDVRIIDWDEAIIFNYSL